MFNTSVYPIILSWYQSQAVFIALALLFIFTFSDKCANCVCCRCTHKSCHKWTQNGERHTRRESESVGADLIEHVGLLGYCLNAFRIENQTDKDILAAIEANGSRAVMRCGEPCHAATPFVALAAAQGLSRTEQGQSMTKSSKEVK